MVAVNRAWSQQRVAADCAPWPNEAERARWLALFGDDSVERVWARETAYQNAGVYSRYFLMTGESDVTPRGLKIFIRLCEMGGMKRRCSPRTVAGYVAAIYKVLRLLHPDTDLRALRTIMWRMLRLADRTPKQRTAAIADAVDLERAAWRMIEAGRKIRRADRERGAMLFRTALYLLMGLYMPERLRAFASLTVQQVNLDAGLIVFRPDQTKNKRESERRIPADLVPLIREWLEIRASFHPDHDLFWISLKSGGAAAPATLYAALRSETDDPFDFSVTVTPHSLRNAAATFIVRQAPEKASIASVVLVHRNSELTDEYIEGAGTIEASRKGGHIVMSSGEVPKIDGRRGPRRYKRGKRVLIAPARATVHDSQEAL
ncbi:MAG TPA: tyrosine-type recombinase/integrase [Stellaceae bacterium]|nr:tyrosine-type recombinase/integrase [Stellaceae bacterium]